MRVRTKRKWKAVSSQRHQKVLHAELRREWLLLQQTKKFLSLFLAVVMLFSILSVPVFAEAGAGNTESGATEKTEQEILSNCSVQLTDKGEVRTEAFQEDSTSTEVKVKLDESVESCYLNIYAYAGNTSFDPDGSFNTLLWSGRVTDGYHKTCDFKESALPLKPGYKVIASLNVPVGEDNYKPVNSQAIEIVDESGEGFQDYTYPDASIDEKTLKAGEDRLHISLTGDERLFQYAQEGKISITCAVAQYPGDESFDFEGDKQISLASNIDGSKAFSGKEIKLSEPLKEGYRVRAVVYWSQNTELFLPKGNDYEEVFGRPDDSVLVTAGEEQEDVKVSIASDVTSKSDTVEVNVNGEMPEGSVLMLKSFEKSDTNYVTQGGTLVASVSAVSGKNEIKVTDSSGLLGGNKIVAFLLKSGELIAQSDPAVVTEEADFTITQEGELTEDSSQAVFKVEANDTNITNINIAKLCRADSGGEPETSNPVAVLYGQKTGRMVFELAGNALKEGDRVVLVLTYNNGESTYTSEVFSVNRAVEADSLAIQNSQISTDTTSVTVTVKGCDSFKGGYLFVTTGSPSTDNDGDSRTKLSTVTFTGENTYQCDFSSSAKLKAGNTIQAYLYKYDADTDRTSYRYSNSVTISSGSTVETEPEVAIVTDTISADRTDVWVAANFSESLEGTLTLYTYSGESFDRKTATEIYSGSISPSENSQKITFGEGHLTAGEKLIALLALSDGRTVESESKNIAPEPEKVKPEVKILNETITAGVTAVKASVTFDASADHASYKLYKFTGDSLDPVKDEVIASGNLYRSQKELSVYISGKIAEGDKLQMLLTVDGETAQSQVVTVLPSPDWGTPYVAFNVAAVKADDKTVSLTVDYSDEYLTLGDDFYCDITVYQYPGTYTDDEFEDGELWENSGIAKRVAQINSNWGDVTKGKLTLAVKDGAELNAGDRLAVKLRLPHTEWEGEEVDYISASVPVVAASAEIPDYKVVLYNLDEDTSRGYRLHSILENLGIPYEKITDKHLNETVGYLAGLEGYEAAETEYDGEGNDSEFMLMCNFPEALLDRFLTEMTDNGLRINHKAVVTEYNRDYQFHELIDDIEEEHDVFQALLDLDDMIQEAEKLKEEQYGEAPGWQEFATALEAANHVLASYEPTFEELQAACDKLKNKYLEVTEMEEITGNVTIDIEKEDSGTYSMTAELTKEEGTPETEYEFLWSNGKTGKTISGISEKKLISTTVSVTGENLFGELTAQLQVPDAPQPKISCAADRIKANWQKAEEKENQPAATGYRAAVYKGGELVKEIETGETVTSVEFTGLESNTSYTVKICAVSPVGRSDMSVINALTSKAEETEKPETLPNNHPGKTIAKAPKVKAASTGYRTIKVSWNASPGAIRYDVYRAAKKSGSYKKIAATKGKSYTDKKLTFHKRYYYKVVAVGSGGNGTSGIVSAKTALAKTQITKLTGKKKSYRNLKWKKVAGARGYKVVYSTRKNFKKKTVKSVTTKKTSLKLKKLRKGKKYYIKVRAYRTYKGKKVYSRYSAVKAK